MFETIGIAPSILSANFMHMEKDIRMLEEAGADYVHVDVMDGHFVPNLTLGVPFVQQLKDITRLPLDVHLMIDNPLSQIPWFLEAGSDILTIHMESLDEAQDEVHRALEMISSAHCKRALCLKPDTPVSVLQPYISQVDMVLIMSVYPGFSGQSYIAGSEDRVAQTVSMAQKAGVSPLIQVDGGIGLKTVSLVCSKGADVLVAGNAVFKADNPSQAIAQLKHAGTKAQQDLG